MNTDRARHVQEILAQEMAKVEQIVARYCPDALDPLKAALAVCAVASLSDNSQPTTLHLIGQPSAGKTLPLELIMPAHENDPLAEYFYRSDNFTASSFVSHRADRSHEQLREIDLLPKIKDRTLITPELAPLFRGKRDELTKTFGVLTRVLDGQGYVTDTGAQGHRGYMGSHNFQWLGATTPPSPEALEVMGQLGPRLLFYNADRLRPSIDELFRHARRSHDDEKYKKAKEQCRKAVRNLLLEFYRHYPPGSLRSRVVECSDHSLRQLVLWAEALTRLRATLRWVESREDHDATSQQVDVESWEFPERILAVLTNIAIGSALVRGRQSIDAYDLAQVRHIALSSGVPGRGRVLSILLDNGGEATTPEIQQLAHMSAPTALNYMRELQTVGLARLAGGRVTTVKIAKKFRELCNAPSLKPNGAREGNRA